MKHLFVVMAALLVIGCSNPAGPDSQPHPGVGDWSGSDGYGRAVVCSVVDDSGVQAIEISFSVYPDSIFGFWQDYVIPSAPVSGMTFSFDTTSVYGLPVHVEAVFNPDSVIWVGFHETVRRGGAVDHCPFVMERI